MRFIVDANIFIHALNNGSAHQAAARDFLDQHGQLGTRWGTTWPILYEFLRVATHPKVYERPLSAAEALAFVTGVVKASPTVTILADGPRHLEALVNTIDEAKQPAGSIYHDLHTVALMKEYGVREIITADAGFLRFSQLKVTNPLALR